MIKPLQSIPRPFCLVLRQHVGPFGTRNRTNHRRASVRPCNNIQSKATSMKTNLIGKSFSVLAIMAIAAFSLLSASAQTQPWGTALGSFNGVVNYSNGSGTYSSGVYNTSLGINSGLEWQCVEYVQ